MSLDSGVDPSCGCCEGTAAGRPETISNRSGLAAIAYRVGDHGAFKASMLARLSSADPRFARLAALKTRADDDFTNGLLDAWASSAEVLSFYSERFANEHYLRTATERLSVLELARLIGYKTRPGVAASTRIAFTLEEGRNGLPPPVVATQLAAGIKLQSTPGPDETAQMFETIEPLELRVSWNALKARQTEPQPIGFGTRSIWLAGTASQLKIGDFILFVGSERESDPDSDHWDLRRLTRVTPDFAQDRTQVAWSEGLGSYAPFSAPASAPKVFAFRLRAALFGHNAPDPRTLSAEVADAFGLKDAAEWVFPDLVNPFHVDGLHPGIVVKSWIALSRPEYRELYRVEAASESAQTGFTLNAKTTAVEVDSKENLGDFGVARRETVVLAQSEALAIAERPITGLVRGQNIVLNRLLEGDDRLPDGRWIIVDEDLADPAAAQAAPEWVQIDYSDVVEGLTRLWLQTPLAGSFRRELCRIRANVVLATHGESTEEILGSGDARVAHPRFTLKQKPLTQVSAATASGTESTLELRVDDLLWREVSTLYNSGPGERIYTTQQDDDGSTELLFGDGVEGARLSTGSANVRARYRKGIGLAGNVRAGQLNQLLSRPLGLKDATNPLPASGGDDPEALAHARANAPFTVRTLDRAVSLTDFGDFARAFAGIAKASSAWVWDGRRRRVHVTVAGPGGVAIDAGSETSRNLMAAIQAAADPHTALVLQGFRAAYFTVAANLIVHPDYRLDTVAAAVEAALLETFSFEARAFGQPVFASEVTAAMQSVDGVVAAHLVRLHRSSQPPSLQNRLLADTPHLVAANQFVSAELLLLDQAPPTLIPEFAP